MTSRKNRLSLSLASESVAKSPNLRLTPSRRARAARPSSENQPTNDERYEVSPSQGGDFSPVVPFTQEAFHAINGVSWEWNSPQRLNGQPRLRADTKKSTSKVHTRKTIKHIESPCGIAKKATGFNKFISKLNLLMGKENMEELGDVPEPLESNQEPVSEASDTSDVPLDAAGSVVLIDANEVPEKRSPEPTADSDDDLFQDAIIDAGSEDTPNGDSLDAGLDDSRLNSMLIKASQTAEQNINKPTSPQAAASPPSIGQGSTKAKPTRHSIPSEMNDSDMDGFLVQASLMAEEKRSSPQESSCSNSVLPSNDVATSRRTNVSKLNSATSSNVRSHPAQKSASKSPPEGSSGETSSMSQDEIKTLIEKKRQEALRRLQNNRLRRAMKGTTTNG
ncbi:protein hsr-9-like [Anopheles cruzii]|uniref:protein hsr-9-like n=1 Tax=Anopheles cruzii TaxID=68878 RepID=UPI0022EC5D26|nr:protein hsr-9-like [Anopheles cruzii]